MPSAEDRHGEKHWLVGMKSSLTRATNGRRAFVVVLDKGEEAANAQAIPPSSSGSPPPR